MHVSTSDVFGIPRGDELIDESTPYREWGEPYPDTKIAAERWLWQFHRESGLPLSVIYPCWVYGPGDQAFFPSLAQAIDDGVMLFWHRQTRLFWAYVDNLADAIVLAGTHPAAVGNGYLVHDGDDGPTLQEVCARIAALAGKPAADPPRPLRRCLRRRVRSPSSSGASCACAARRCCSPTTSSPSARSGTSPTPSCAASSAGPRACRSPTA